MVDFKKLRAERSTSKAVDPIEIFQRFPKTETINDLWSSQAEALIDWNKRRKDKDVVIKLNTGGGKTLVGLLIAQSISNETDGSTLYLCPTRQLVDQTYDLATHYGFRSSKYEGSADFDNDFLTGKNILIATYAALFNGKSKFRTTEYGGECIKLEGIILDDAHTSFSIIRDQFTLSINRIEYEDVYLDLCNLFRSDFDSIGKIGTFDDIIQKKDHAVLEVPYWCWKEKSNIVRDKINANASNNIVWSLLRNEFDYCHALVDRKSFCITPIFPLVDKFPSFSDCPRRIYMSATLSDDSSIVRTFDADVKSVKKPITPKSLSGVGERMILLPVLMGIENAKIPIVIEKIIRKVSEKAGVIILVPSIRSFEKWRSIATIPNNATDVTTFINSLKSGATGPFAFANRYDGLDLPNDSCRLLILDGRPMGQNSYDSFRLFTLGNSELVNASSAQKIEQGLGRGTRGSGDFCVIILLGNDLISWISKTNNVNQLTPSTRTQLEMGVFVSQQIKSLSEFEDTIDKCLQREKDWVEYHAERLAESVSKVEIGEFNLEIAAAERRYFEYIRKNSYDNAISSFEQYIWGSEKLDKYYKGWLFQLNARAYWYWGNEQKSQELQKKAYSRNSNLLKLPIDSAFSPITPGEQSRNIMNELGGYRIRKGYLSNFDEIVKDLTLSASSNQFEEALKNLGIVLGFNASRPEKEIGKGPDVLWLLKENTKNIGLIIEAKHQKMANNPLTKAELGQILTSYDWFKSAYPTYEGVKVVVHPNNYTTRSILPNGLYSLPPENLGTMIINARRLSSLLCESSAPIAQLSTICEQKLAEYNLTIEGILGNYSTLFQEET
jgi:replicative superfamily II helicase